jgi:hypothetical protein
MIMTDTQDKLHKTQPTDSEPGGAVPEDEAPVSLMMEFLYFLKDNKKWWLLPLIVMFLLLGLLITLSASPLAPFIYSFF